MKNRETSIGICGAVVGLLIGAGSVSYSQNVSDSLLSSLLAQAPLGYHNYEFDEAYKRRSIKEAEHTAAPEPEPVKLTMAEKAACEDKIAITEEVQEILLPLLPGRPVDYFVRNNMERAIESYLEECREGI